jgi:hypothetical protein
MDPAVWKWANDDVDAKKSLLKSCSNVNCGAVEQNVTQFKRCAACKEVRAPIGRESGTDKYYRRFIVPRNARRAIGKPISLVRHS